MMTKLFSGILFAGAIALGATVSLPAGAADKIRLMKVVPHPFAFLMADVGKEQGIFSKHGIDLEILGTRGSARLHQALAADSTDIGLGSGVGLGFVAKGAPQIGFLASHGAPLNLGIVVTTNSPLYDKSMTVKDLKGKKIGVSTPSSLTYFLSRRMAAEQGWGPDGITAVPLGSLPAQLAAAKAGNTHAFVMSVDAGYNLQAKGTGRVFLAFGDYIKDFHTHVLFVTNKFREKNPDAVKRFAQAWLESVNYVLDNKEAMVQRGMKQLKFSREVAENSYDLEAPAFSRTGRFDQKALNVIAEGLVVTKILSSKPDMSKTYTEEYLPN